MEPCPRSLSFSVPGIVFAVLFALASAPVAAQQFPVEVIQLKYRSAEQVLPVLTPLVPKPGTISGMQNNLIIRTTPSNLAEIKRVLETIDAMPRRLMITVRQDADAGRGRDTAGVSGSVTIGNNARITVPGPGGNRGATVEARTDDSVARARVLSTQSLENDRTTQQVQVLEGSSAFIRVGQSVPVPVRTVVPTVIGGGRVIEQVVDTVEYRDVLTGFNVLPRLAGDQVTLEVSPQRDTPGNLGPGSVNIQHASTTVSGRLGEWIELGGIVSGRSFDDRVNATRTAGATGDNRRILLRVDEIR